MFLIKSKIAQSGGFIDRGILIEPGAFQFADQTGRRDIFDIDLYLFSGNGRCMIRLACLVLTLFPVLEHIEGAHDAIKGRDAPGITMELFQAQPEIDEAHIGIPASKVLDPFDLQIGVLVWVMGRTMGAIGEGADIIIMIPMDPKINELAGNFVTDGGLCSTDTVIRENNG